MTNAGLVYSRDHMKHLVHPSVVIGFLCFPDIKRRENWKYIDFYQQQNSQTLLHVPSMILTGA